MTHSYFQVTDLKVKRHSFEGIRVDGSFLLENVIVQRTPSLAFAFDAVKQFSIFASRFDRVSMWGFKLDECIEFNALAKSRFFSLASQAMHMKCNKFMLTDNTFDNLHDSSLGLTYGLLDVQGNTFEKLTGKPFVDMRPLIELVSKACLFHFFQSGEKLFFDLFNNGRHFSEHSQKEFEVSVGISSEG